MVLPKQNFVQQAVQIPTPDGKVINAYLYTAANPSKPTDKPRPLIIHLHGFTHSCVHYLELLYPYAAIDAGYDLLIPSLYDNIGNTRRLYSIKFSDHLADLQTLITYGREISGQKIALSGHSLGGLVILATNPEDIQAVSMWDPSFDVMYFWDTFKLCIGIEPMGAFLGNTLGRILDYKTTLVVSDDFFKELEHYPHDVCLERMEEFQTPVQIIKSGIFSIFDIGCRTPAETFIKAAPKESELTVILGADHRFVQPTTADELFTKTLGWFDKFCS